MKDDRYQSIWIGIKIGISIGIIFNFVLGSESTLYWKKWQWSMFSYAVICFSWYGKKDCQYYICTYIPMYI